MCMLYFTKQNSLFTQDGGLPFGFLIYYLFINRVIIILDLDVILDKCELIGEPVQLPKNAPDLIVTYSALHFNIHTNYNISDDRSIGDVEGEDKKGLGGISST